MRRKARVEKTFRRFLLGPQACCLKPLLGHDFHLQKALGVGGERVGNIAFGAKPFIIYLEIEPGRDCVHQANIDGLTEVGVIFSHGHAVRLVGIKLTDDRPVVGLRSFRLQARKAMDGVQLAGLKAKAPKPDQWAVVGEFYSYEPYGMAMRKMILTSVKP